MGAARQRPSGHHPGRGFTLVEVLVSMTILAILLTSFASSAIITLVYSRHEDRLTEAVALLDAGTEALLLANADSTRLTIGEHSSTFDAHGAPVDPSAAYFTVTWTVTSLASTPGIRRIDLRVSWNETGRPYSVRWTTFRN